MSMTIYAEIHRPAGLNGCLALLTTAQLPQGWNPWSRELKDYHFRDIQAPGGEAISRSDRGGRTPKSAESCSTS